MLSKTPCRSIQRHRCRTADVQGFVAIRLKSSFLKVSTCPDLDLTSSMSDPLEFAMSDAIQISANVMIAYATYVVGTASPGPSNLAVMATAMEEGRRHAFILALGIVSGSVFWGLIAAFGLAAVIAARTDALIAMKLLGGTYMAWLAFRSTRSALGPDIDRSGPARGARNSVARTYVYGAAMHLTNPKAIFVWLAIVTLALPVSASKQDALIVVAGCAVLGVLVFGGYALVFSTATARRTYLSLRRWFEGLLALVFGYAAIRMFLSAG